MLKILITKKVIESLQCTVMFFGVTDDGTVPDHFWAYPNTNETEVEGENLIQVYPVMDVTGVETWAQDNDAEEVQVWSSDEFQEQHMPLNVRWFVDKKPQDTGSLPPKRRRLLR